MDFNKRRADSIKILAIGNSFSVNAMAWLHQILHAFGINEAVLGNLCIGGCSVERHYNNFFGNLPAYNYRKNVVGNFVDRDGTPVTYALRDENWDIVTLQQCSGLSGVKSTYNDQIAQINEQVKKTVDNKNLKTAWHMTWAYQKNSTNPDFAKYGCDQMTMYRQIVDCVQTIISPLPQFDYVIPAGTAIQNARTSRIGDNLTADGYHLNMLGEYIVGLCWALELTGRDISDFDTDRVPSFFANDLDVILESAVNAINNPFAITPSKLK